MLVVIVIGLAHLPIRELGARIWRHSAAGPDALVAPLMARFRAVGLTVGTLVLIIVYLSLGLTRCGLGVALQGDNGALRRTVAPACDRRMRRIC